jgi:thiol:disulfide interchange protein DsbD
MKKHIILPLVALFLLVANASAQIEFPEDKVNWEFSIEQNGAEAYVVGKITVVDHWHVYGANLPEESFLLPTEVEPDKSPNYEVIGKVIEPKPEFYHDEAADEDIFQHSKSFTLKRKLKITSEKDFTLKGRFSFQTCDESHCLPPFDTDFELKVKGLAVAIVEDAAIEDVAEAVVEIASIEFPDEDSNVVVEVVTEDAVVPVAEAQGGNKKKESKKISDLSIWTIFFLSFGAGFAALLTPCVFPMIPMTVSFFTKQSKSKAAGIRNATFYGVCIIGIYVILGTLVTWLFGASILNWLSTQWWFNMAFFILLVVFAVSFMGAFEITLPSSWINKADKASDKGGMVGIFFMALVLALVSFSCTGPIVGTLLVEAADIGGIAPVIGMLGFSLALALPFALFAAFPGWLNTMPKSGGWLTSVKVFLGFLELALAFKFLSNADLAVQAHLLEREMFLAIWIAVFGVLAMYLFGFIQLPHDGPAGNLSVGRMLLGTATVVFVVYMIPGLWGAPLKLISAFPPPMHYSESPMGVGRSGGGGAAEHGPEGTHLGPQNIWVFHDMEKAQAYAKKVGKPLFVDFTGHNCVNCRAMEQSVWGESGIIDKLKEDVVITSLYVDEDVDLPLEEQVEVELAPGKMKTLKTVGDKWAYTQIKKYKITAQPYYRMLGPNGEDLDNGSADYKNHSDPKVFQSWLDEGLKLYKAAK